jgi:hypothetical protein
MIFKQKILSILKEFAKGKYRICFSLKSALSLYTEICTDYKSYMQDTRYIKYAEQERNARNNRITVKYPA